MTIPWVENNDDGLINRTTSCTCNRVNQEDVSDVSETSMPLISRTSSSICLASPTHQDVVVENPDGLDDVDGLPVIHIDVQLRVQQIIAEHKVSLIFLIVLKAGKNYLIKIIVAHSCFVRHDLTG